MTAYTITANEAFNSLEISFNEKPGEAIREALKALKFRWHGVKKIWYGYADRETVEKALNGETITAETAPKAKAASKKPDKINLDNLGQNKPSLWGSELAAAIREDLKRRGVKGCTVRARKITYDTGITVTITAQPEELASVEEIALRYNYSRFTCYTDRGFYDGEKWVYNFDSLTDEEKHTEYEKYISYIAHKAPEINKYHFERAEYPTITTAFYNKVRAVFLIANQWNYDNSDSMSDYFDVGYYLDIDIKLPKDYEPREKMTAEEKAGYNEELRQAEEQRKADFERYEQEKREAEAARKAYEEQRAKDRETIANHMTAQDLTESEYIYITDVVGGCGKDATIEELDQYINECPHYNDALITRKVIFDSREAFEVFGRYLLDDFDFLAGMGGTASEDVRLEGVDFYHLNAEQRETVKAFMNKCIGVYVDNELQLISDPQGYNYSRYTYRPTENSKQLNGSEETSGGEYKKIFLRDNHSALVYDGILPTLPDSVTRREITAHMYEVLNYSELFPRILEYYAEQGKQPIIDTIQR